MATYVIVHGGFFGGWRWRTVANLLREASHEVFTPTLTGLGERSHLANPDVDLSTHIQDIVGVIECEDLQDVILLGHSSGSMVITGVAERIPERLRYLVYLDTLIPHSGQSWLDLLGPKAANMLVDLANQKGDGWRIPLISDSPRINPHPLKTTTDKLTITNPAAAAIPRGYIFCSAKLHNSPVAFAARAIEGAARQAQQQGWWYRELPTDHGADESMPQELSNLLLELA